MQPGRWNHSQLGSRPRGLRGWVDGPLAGWSPPRQPQLSPLGETCRIVLYPLVPEWLGANSPLHPWPGLSLALPPCGLGERADVRLARNEFKSGPVTSELSDLEQVTPRLSALVFSFVKRARRALRDCLSRSEAWRAQGWAWLAHSRHPASSCACPPAPSTPQRDG